MQSTSTSTIIKFFDKLLENISSREFQIFIVATILFILKLINEEMWLMLSLGFMGLRTAQKLMPKNNNNNENNPGI